MVPPGPPAADATRPPGLSPTKPADRDSLHSRAGTHESGTGPLRRRGFRPPPAISTRRLYPGMPSAGILNSADFFSRTDLSQFPEESESECGRLSGIPVVDASPASTTSQATRNKKCKQKRRSSSPSDESRRKKTLRSHRKDVGQSVTPADFMLAFQNISDALSALAQRRDGSNAPPVATFPNPRSQLTGTGETGPDRVGPPTSPPAPGNDYMGPATPARAWQVPGSPADALSIHPSVTFDHSDAEMGNMEEELPAAQLLEIPPDAPSDQEGSLDAGNLSSFETQLRLVQRDMVRVLKLPSTEKAEAETSHQSFKLRTAPAEVKSPTFPELPFDRLCVERMENLAKAKTWRSCQPRARSYFQFPRPDFEQFLQVPKVPDTARDKLSADGGRATPKSGFIDKQKAKTEDLLVSLDRAARFGIRTNAFLLLLSEYLVCACEEQSPVPADLMVAAFKCLDEGLRTTLDQFARDSLLATSSRRANVLLKRNGYPIRRSKKETTGPTLARERPFSRPIPRRNGNRGKAN